VTKERMTTHNNDVEAAVARQQGYKFGESRWIRPLNTVDQQNNTFVAARLRKEDGYIDNVNCRSAAAVSFFFFFRNSRMSGH